MAVREQRAAQTPVAELKEEREETHGIGPEETPYLPAHVAVTRAVDILLGAHVPWFASQRLDRVPRCRSLV